MTLLVGDHLVVGVHYKLTDDDGNVLESTEGAEPMVYLHGKNNIISGLEKALAGKAQGDSCKVRVEPAEGYGKIKPELVETIEKEIFRGVDVVKEGMTFGATDPSGAARRVVVKKVEGDKITIDANHPLAGIVLNFDIEIDSVREATKEEIEHGHIH